MRAIPIEGLEDKWGTALIAISLITNVGSAQKFWLKHPI